MSTGFRIVLDGSQENPSNASKAFGNGYAVFDSTNTTLTFSVSVYGLDFGVLFDGGVEETPGTADNVTDMHIHNKARGANGSVVFAFLNQDDDLFNNKGGDGSRHVGGIWETTDPASTSLNTFKAQLGSATVGSDVDLYVNVHTKTFPGGEIRGQLVAISNDSDNVINGIAANEYIPGLGGNDTFNASGGSDFTDGGAGDDTHFVNDATDVAFEAAGQGAADKVFASVSYLLLPGSEVEFLATTNAAGKGAIDLTGNQFAQEITGNAGNNVLSDGGIGGSDTLIGLAGNDTYVIFNSGTKIVEAAAAGTDIVRAAVNYTVGSGVYIQTLESIDSKGTAGLSLFSNEFGQTVTGNAGNNTLRGYGGNDTINGGAGNDKISGGTGNDTLSGNAGADTYYFSYALNEATNVDTIKGFSGIDLISLAASIFTKAGPAGTLAATAFAASADGNATTAAHRILYETDTGILRYDADGTGAAAAIKFAVMAGLPTMNAGDFVVA
ncbi:MAG: CHRD domain-containing protein [Rhizobiaceae bacterium]|nr:CHRD domain-containing protein [Rhizobiaceae bacterium]